MQDFNMKKYLLKFISPSFVNMEIAHVYKKENIAVATDSYKLLKIKLDDYFENVLPDGYYTREEWKILSDEKKKDQWERIILTPRPELGAFPDYNQIMPKDTEVEAYKGKLGFNFLNLKDFLEARNESEKIAGRPYKKDLCFNPGELLESAKGILYHKNENSRILLMPINIDKR